MIRLITGTPGSGKTLYTVSEIMKVIEKTPERPIFSDIKGLRIDGVQEAPDDWRAAPDGALIIYDECQYRTQYTKSRGRNKHQMIIDLTTHRHTGKDIWLITQNPNFLHSDVLAVVGEHYHIDRPLKASFANVYKWRTAQLKPDGITVRRRAEAAPIFKCDKELFDYYDSVDVSEDKAYHKKFQMPSWKFFVLPIGVLILLWAFWGIVSDGITPSGKDKKDNVNTNNVQKTDETQAQTPVLDDKKAKDEAPTEPMPATITKEQMEKQLKLQEEHFNYLLEQQRLQLIMQYDTLQKQLIEHQQQIDEFYRTIELYKTMLPKDHKIIKNNPDLQVRGVVKMGNQCRAYNAQGVLMTLNHEQCSYYTEATGRVWKNGQTTDNSPSQPRLPQALTDNSTRTLIPAPQEQTPEQTPEQAPQEQSNNVILSQ